MIRGDTSCKFTAVTAVLFDYLSVCEYHYATEEIWNNFWSVSVSTAYWLVVTSSGG